MSRDIETCMKVLEKILREDNPERFLKTVLSEAVHLLGADYGIWIERESGAGTPIAFRECGQAGDPSKEYGLMQDSGPVQKIESTRVLSDYPNSSGPMPALVGFGIQKVLEIPVRIDGSGNGIVTLGFRDPDSPLDPDVVRFLEFLFTQAELLLRRSRAIQDQRTLKNQPVSVSRLYKALTSINALILRKPEEQELLSETIRIMIELGGFIATGFYFADLEKRVLELGVYKITDESEDFARYPLSFSLDPDSPGWGQSVTVQCFLTKREIIVNDLLTHYQNLKASKRVVDYKSLSFHSTAVFPLIRKGECAGVFAFVSKEKDFFTSDISGLLSEITRILSMTLDSIDMERERKESEDRLSTLIEHLPEAIVFKDGSGRWKTVNPAASALFKLEGFPGWFGKTDLELVREFPEFSGHYRTTLFTDEGLWTSKKPVTGLDVFPEAGAPSSILESTKIPLFSEDGSRKGLIITAHDITEKKKNEEIRERYARIIENTSEGIMIAGADRKILDVNKAFTQITGFDREDVLGKNPKILSSGVQRNNFYREMWTSIHEEGRWEGEIWNRKKSGSIYCEWLSISVLKEEGRVTHYIGIFSDISDRKSNAQRIEYLASHDSLTDLPNRRLFKEFVEIALSQSLGKGESFAVGILDLDAFKSINDRLGHLAGDDLLIRVARRLKGTLRKNDILARMGGDEFGMLLSGFDKETLSLAIDKIMAIFQRPFLLEKGKKESVRVTGSLGLTLCPPDQGPFESLLAHADIAMYRVKENGRNGWALFEREMEDSLNEQHRIREEFAEALRKNRLVLHYQPKVCMKTGRIEGVEALVRWMHPKQGLLYPMRFIDVIERSDLINSLGRWALQNAVAHQTKWKEMGLNLNVSVNIGAKHFLSESFIPSLRADLSDLFSCPSTKDGHGISLEITEKESLSDLGEAREVIDQCRALGVGVSLDDFGTGQASVKALQELNIDEVKIDQGFIRQIMTSPRNLAIVASLISTAHMLLIRVVAEGVESEEEGEILGRLGCLIAQGNAISPPMPAERLPDWISSWTPPVSWKIGQSCENVRIEDLSLTMIKHSLNDFLEGILSDLDRPPKPGEKDRTMPPCIPCAWISYAEKLHKGRIEEGFATARIQHGHLHALITEAFAARNRKDGKSFRRFRGKIARIGRESGELFQELSRESAL